MRQIVFDTETTGFEPSEGHKIVEIGAVEIINYVATGKTYHQYINPERDIPEEVVQVHGIDNDKVKDCPIFSQIVGEFLDFIGDDVLVAHNANFDMKFINHELKAVGMPEIQNDRVIDTLEIARQKFPGSPKTLDALCKRFGIGLEKRTLHGALLDSELLAEVYLELVGGRQQGLGLGAKLISSSENKEDENKKMSFKQWPERSFTPSDLEKEKHQEMVSTLKDAKWTEWFNETI